MKLIQGCPPALPGSCYLCGSASRDVYVDLETDVEFHGAMYLCNECIREMGTLLGMMDKKKASALKLNTQTIEIERDRLREELAALKDVANAIGRVNSLPGGSSALAGDGVPSEDASVDVPGDAEAAPTGAK